MNKTPFPLIVILLMFAISACAPAAAAPTQQASPAVVRAVIHRDAAASYAAVMQIQFIGTKNWAYQLKTRKAPTLREISLHIDGLQGAQNPGDIRLVTDNAITRMIGPGTDNQCVQFPNGQGMDPTFIYPESLVPQAVLDSSLKPVGEEQLEGFSVLHFRATGVASGPWKDATIDLWQEKDSAMLRQFSMTADGTDPFFASGAGKLTVVYIAGPLGSEEISPVTGCEINVPLPEAISMYVRLPGMASFESKSGMEDLVKFFQTSLPGQKWVEKEAPVRSKGSTVLSYQRGAESVEIHIESAAAGGSKIKLLFIQG